MANDKIKWIVIGVVILKIMFMSQGKELKETNKIEISTYQENADSYFVENNYVYINYNKLGGASSNSLWRVKHGYSTDGPYDISIPADCWNQDPLKFRIYSEYRVTSYPECYNGGEWINIGIIRIGGGTGSATKYFPPTRYNDGNWNTGDFFSSSWPGYWWLIEFEDSSSSIYEEAMVWDIQLTCDNEAELKTSALNSITSWASNPTSANKQSALNAITTWANC